jgi:hypothetical protein
VLAHSSQKPAIGTPIVKAASHRIPGDRRSDELHSDVNHKATRFLLTGALWSLSPDKRGGLNGSTQHSARTHFALKTKAKIAR